MKLHLLLLLLPLAAHAGPCESYAKSTSPEGRAVLDRQNEELRRLGVDMEAHLDAARRGLEKTRRACELSKLPPPRIGMTADEARGSSWGEPEQVHTTLTAGGTTEQWVYPDGRFLYFTDGRLTAAQF